MEDDECRTLWCGNLSDRVTEEVLYELFLQAAPLKEVRIPTDKSGRKANYGFVVVKHEVSIDYVVQLLDGTTLYDRQITIKPRRNNQARNSPQRNVPDAQNLLVMGQLLQMPLNNTTPPFHQRSSYNKPYQRHDNYSGRHNWNNNYHRNNHGNERNRRRYH